MIFIGGWPSINKLKLALEHVAGFGARMGMAACGAACGNFRNRGDGVVAGREIELLQRRALDAGLLGDGDTGARECHDGQSEQNLFDHVFSPCGESLAALARCWKRPRRRGTYRLIPSKLAAMPRWNSDQSKPSASAT